MITKGEIAKGHFVTVLKWLPREFPAVRMLGFDGGTHVDRSWVGDVLEVMAVDLPFIVVEHRSASGYNPIQLNMDELVLKELSPEFVAASIGNGIERLNP